MGVHATWCQLCGLPVQHDHYVPSHRGGLNIYRGSMPDVHDWSREPKKPFPFTADHAWLRDAVAVGDGVKRGHVEDGSLDDALFVGDGTEDALVFHHFCWELMGEPSRRDDAQRGVQTLVFERLYPYQEQLFDFHRFAADGNGELLLDPTRHASSRRRIEAVLEAAKKPFSFDAPSSLAQVLAWDRDWMGTAARNANGDVLHHVQYRRAPTRRMDLSAYPNLLAFLLEYDGAMPKELVRLQALQLEAKAALEHDGLGVVVMFSTGERQQQLLAYVKDLAEGHRRIDALPWNEVTAKPDYDDASDPTWKVFFEQMGLPTRAH